MPLIYPVFTIIFVLLTTAGVMKFRADQRQKIDTSQGIVNTSPDAPFDEYALKIGTFNPDQITPTVNPLAARIINPKITKTPRPSGSDPNNTTTQDTDEMSSTNCTLTIGFWKTHAGFGPQADVLSQYLPIYLGTEGGEDTIIVATNTKAVDLLEKSGDAANGFNRLYAQLLGSKLNIKSGADVDEISSFLQVADKYLAKYESDDWLEITPELQQAISQLAEVFDEYNNGIRGPGHCP